MSTSKISGVYQLYQKHAGPRLWNRIPQQIKNSKTLGVFKTKLKTYLFAKYYVLN